MNDLKLSELIMLQKTLQEAHPEWGGLCPQQARNQLLYMVEELGEVIAIIKKKGESAIMEDSIVRENLCTELCDVLMYFTDALLCYGITAEEFSAAYEKKHCYNLKRNYEAQNRALYAASPTKALD